jgi:hypothetical protein
LAQQQAVVTAAQPCLVLLQQLVVVHASQRTRSKGVARTLAQLRVRLPAV